ncbi:uncharacterized protein V6R79_009652 [Siganus canaliculatus]
MKSCVLFLVVVLALGCSGIPMYSSELESMAERGLEAAMTQVNSAYAVNGLYRPTRASVARVIPVGMNTYDLLMAFDIKETECAKASKSNPQTCAFKSGIFVPTFSCSSRVRTTSTSNQVISLKCGTDDSVSSESSEEILSRGRHRFNIPLGNRGPAVPAPAAPVQPSHSLQSPLEIQSRGETNFVV